jgi:hypothetical protein
LICKDQACLFVNGVTATTSFIHLQSRQSGSTRVAACCSQGWSSMNRNPSVLVSPLYQPSATLSELSRLRAKPGINLSTKQRRFLIACLNDRTRFLI